MDYKTLKIPTWFHTINDGGRTEHYHLIYNKENEWFYFINFTIYNRLEIRFNKYEDFMFEHPRSTLSSGFVPSEKEVEVLLKMLFNGIFSGKEVVFYGEET